MIEFSPVSALAAIRGGGSTVEGRLTSTDEQRRQAVDWALETMRAKKTTEIRFTVLWTRGEPTILDVKANVEHLAGEVVYLSIASVKEFSMSGAEIKLTAAQRMERLTLEVAAMVESKTI